MTARRNEPADEPAGDGTGHWPTMSFTDRMDTVRFDVSPNAHIVVDGRKCADCSTRGCIVVCPANL